MSGGVQFLMKKNKIDVIMGTGKILPEKQIEVTDTSNKNTILQIILLLQQVQDQDNYPIYHKMENKLLVTETAMVLPKMPKKMVIVGSGAIGVEFAYFYNQWE